MIFFDIENWLWKYDFDTLTVLHYVNLKKYNSQIFGNWFWPNFGSFWIPQVWANKLADISEHWAEYWAVCKPFHMKIRYALQKNPGKFLRNESDDLFLRKGLAEQCRRNSNSNVRIFTSNQRPYILLFAHIFLICLAKQCAKNRKISPNV